MRLVTVVNRTANKLHGVWDGKHTDIPVGKSQFNEQAALAFKRQNPVLGSSDPSFATEYDLIVGNSDYKIGIEDHGDDCSPLGVTPEAAERWNREKLVGSRPVEVVKGDNGLYAAPRRSEGFAPMPSELPEK